MNDNEASETARAQEDKYCYAIRIKGRRAVPVMRLASAARVKWNDGADGPNWNQAVYMDRRGRYWVHEYRSLGEGKKWVCAHRIVSEALALSWALNLWTSDHVRGRERISEALCAGAFPSLRGLLVKEAGGGQ